jgi:hypothetical protein
VRVLAAGDQKEREGMHQSHRDKPLFELPSISTLDGHNSTSSGIPKGQLQLPRAQTYQYLMLMVNNKESPEAAAVTH